ncbi:primary-amine oxidase [Nocardia sp. NPDC058499]|uniref:primary-amine oxidase n=1 Tax=Nocardia sp. NPDC058499 TaxID=3346530 RepID=UPI003652C803
MSSHETLQQSSAEKPASLHPLDPITEDEMARAREILVAAGHLTENCKFATIQLQEPNKATLNAFVPGDPVDRRIAVVLADVKASVIKRGVVSVTRSAVDSWETIDTTVEPYAQTGFLLSDFPAVVEIVRADEGWQRAIAERGIDDPSKCYVLSMTPGYFGLAEEQGKRIYKAQTFYRDKETDNHWARPVSGLTVTVDVTNGRVVELLDHRGAPLPPYSGDYTSGDNGRTRTDIKPLEIIQPEGPSFTVEGRFVKWQNWEFRVGFDIREALVLHQIGYRDNGVLRPLVHRASISEMVVPYGDPDPTRYWLNYFDVGEWNLGRMATSLALGCDCLGEIQYFDAVLHDDDANAYTVENVVCMHEEDYGVLWKHNDPMSGIAETRRSRRLVVSFFAAIGNYDYGYFWYFYQDGTIEFEAKLTGIVFASAQLNDAVNPHTSLVAAGLAAPFHQHLFCARLDMAIDGDHNSVAEVDVVSDPIGPDNQFGNAFRTVSTTIDRESIATRNADPSRSRIWKISNPKKRNALGAPTAYKLIPQASQTLLADPESAIAQRAAFATKHLWVTQYDAAERYAAGDLPNQSAGSPGLPVYQAADRPLDGEDIVVWHTFGTTHITRPEDWPIMPVEYTGFMLKPVGFFDRNPSLDLPSPHAGACHADSSSH